MSIALKALPSAEPLSIYRRLHLYDYVRIGKGRCRGIAAGSRFPRRSAFGGVSGRRDVPDSRRQPPAPAPRRRASAFPQDPRTPFAAAGALTPRLLKSISHH